jgi:hypothetical protein
MSRTTTRYRRLDPVEQKIADTLNGSLRHATDERQRRAQLNILQRWAEDLWIFKTPLLLVSLGLVVFILYRYVNQTAGNLVAGTTILVIGLLFLYAPYTLVRAVWRGDTYEDGGFGYPPRTRHYGLGELIGAAIYLMWALAAILGGVFLISRAWR